MLKRGYQGIFHKISHWHLNRYVNEFCGRHNIRSLDTVDMMLSMVAKRLTYLAVDWDAKDQASTFVNGHSPT